LRDSARVDGNRVEVDLGLTIASDPAVFEDYVGRGRVVLEAEDKAQAEHLRDFIVHLPGPEPRRVPHPDLEELHRAVGRALQDAIDNATYRERSGNSN
jgi:hypothetical protein